MRSLRSRLLTVGLLWMLVVLLGVHLLTIVLLQHTWRGVRFIAHFGTLGTIGLAFAVLGISLVRKSLSPLNQLRERLSALREGRDRRVEGSYPSEVQPLVDDLNALLENREQAVARALAKAGDLAHGLKTPLAVLSHEADRASAAGQGELAASVGQQVERMRRQIDHHLALARAAAPGAAPGARCFVAPCAEALGRTLSRLYSSRGLTIDVNVLPELSVRGQREDLDEMLGNLLDNACKWAKTRVAVGSEQKGGSVFLTVDDDGPGLDPSLRDRVLQRGVRADEAAPGSGLGLAIVRDLAELYGGSIVLEASPLGGLRARLQLPS